MTSSLTPPSPSLSHLPAATYRGRVETSLDLAEVLESDRYPSILTRLDSGSSVTESSPSVSRKKENDDLSGASIGSNSPPRHQRDTHQVAMTSKHQSKPPTTGNETDEDDVVDIGRGDQSDTEDAPSKPDTQHQDTAERSRSPAYVAPIPKIGSIPPVSPGIQITPSDRPDLPPFVGSLLMGKLVDEDGDIVDEKTGQVLAHTAGDLPSMMGRRVSNARGDILGDDGELLGYVADIEWPRARPPPTSPPRSLFDLMGRATSSLMVDHTGNILDGSGNVVGRFHDNNNPLHRKEKEEKEAQERAQAQAPAQKGRLEENAGEDQQQQSASSATATPLEQEQQQGQEDQKQKQNQEQPQPQTQPAPGENLPRPRRTEEERKKNAEEWRKENPNESPSDIFLDVKSTREGIQLTIRIPTVFNGQQTTPHISFSS